MNTGPFTSMLGRFGENWRANAPNLAISITGHELDLEQDHPLYGVLVSLCSGRSASLPFFVSNNEVVWCTLAPDSDSLRHAVASLNAWVLPSFGGERPGDGYIQPATATGALGSAIISVSPSGYYRWRCPRGALSQVCDKLRLRHSLEELRPARIRPPRPSLYELRARFAAALLVGDRVGAEEIIQLLDSLQLETAVNTQFMRIRLWHHFREHERIRAHPDLQSLLAQPLPTRVRAWIDEALGVEVAPPALTQATPEAGPPTTAPSTWVDWFNCVKEGNKAAAEIFLQEHSEITTLDMSPSTIEPLVGNLEDLYVDDALRERERGSILQGVAELLEEFVREPGFPRASMGNFYLAVLRLWCALHAGTSIGQEHSHVLLELASAVLQLNLEPEEVLEMLEHWWEVRRTPSQLPYALDAIELLERELPQTEAISNLWLAAADVILRSPDSLAPSDRMLWRDVGARLGFDERTLAQYLPSEEAPGEVEDPLATMQLQKIAIVCLREEQAEQAAEAIRKRSAAEVTVVTATIAGAETEVARQADVVLFVWMASTHAVFRAFDGFDRKRFCYVQGTGAASIVRSLERWVLI